MLSICDLLLYLLRVAQGRRVLIAIALGLLKVGDKMSVPFPVVLDVSTPAPSIPSHTCVCLPLPHLHLFLPSYTCTLFLPILPLPHMHLWFYLTCTPFFACNLFVCCNILYRLLVRICSFWTLKAFSTTSEYLCQRSSLLMLSATNCSSC